MEENLPDAEIGHAESTNGSTKPDPEVVGADGTVAPMDAAAIEQWKRWTFAQIDNGQTAEAVTAELIASGWDPGLAAALVDGMERRAEALWTRSALAQTPSAIFASRSRVPAAAPRFSIVGSVANLIVALYRMLFSDADEELLPRKKEQQPRKGESESPKP